MERSTRQRSAIRTVLEAAARPLSPQEIHAGVQVSVPEIGIATVYRNLKLLLDEGEIQSVTLPGENARYEAARLAHHHHHHFHCTQCDRVFEVEGCPGPMHDLAPAGFTVVRHDLTLYGTCAECAGAAVAAPAKSRGHGHRH